MMKRREIWEAVHYLNKASQELNRCLLMAHHAGIEPIVSTTVGTYGQDGKQIEFPQIQVHVDAKRIADE